MSVKIYTETEIRAMRDTVYGVSSSDKNWDDAKQHWMEPDEIAWLVKSVAKISGK